PEFAATDPTKDSWEIIKNNIINNLRIKSSLNLHLASEPDASGKKYLIKSLDTKNYSQKSAIRSNNP
ncbi:MAG: hypothetical protein ACPG3T_07310, partial [Pseudomonadales bacterium]